MSLDLRLKHTHPGFSLDVALHAPDGITALFGPSGAGKTTIVKAVAGLLAPDAGKISVSGEALFDSETGLNQPPHKRAVGYVFQEARLFPHMTVERNLRYGLQAKSIAVDIEQEAKVVSLLGIGPLLQRHPKTLSGGEQQRVALARALLARPKILLMDEPLAALDEIRKDEILPYLERLRDTSDIPILYVSHSIREVARLATRVALLKRGTLIAFGSTSEIFSAPEHASVFGVQDLGAVLEGRVTAHHADGLTELTTAAGQLLLPRIDTALQKQVRLRIKASDVMLALQPPQDISALNVVKGVVTQIKFGSGPGALVQLRIKQARLLARITRRSAEVMSLAEGQTVFAVVKSVSVARADIGT